MPWPSSFGSVLAAASSLLTSHNRTVPLLSPVARIGSLGANAGNHQVSLTWSAAPGAASYRVYRSPLSGGGYTFVGGTSGTTASGTNVQSRSYTNPATGTTAHVQGARNPYTGNYAYHYNVRR